MAGAKHRKKPQLKLPRPHSHQEHRRKTLVYEDAHRRIYQCECGRPVVEVKE